MSRLFNRNVLVVLLAGLVVPELALAQNFSELADASKVRMVLFEGKRISVDEYLSKDRAIKDERDRWWKKNDPRSRLSLVEYEKLFQNNIELKIEFNGEAITFDAFGIKAVSAVRDVLPSKWSTFAREMSDEIVSTSLEYGQLADFLMRVKKKIDMIWSSQNQRRNKPTSGLIMRATLCSHNSLVRKRQECWLLVDLYPIEDPYEELFISDLRDRLLPKTVASLLTNDLASIPQTIDPHPLSEEANFFYDNQPRLVADRTLPRVTVPQDKLTNAERQALYNFKVIDTRKVNKHQIEGVGGVVADSSREIREAQNLVLIHLEDRIPSGSLLTFDELHLRLGSTAKRVARDFSDCIFVFTLVDADFGKQKQTKIMIEVVFKN